MGYDGESRTGRERRGLGQLDTAVLWCYPGLETADIDHTHLLVIQVIVRKWNPGALGSIISQPLGGQAPGKVYFKSTCQDENGFCSGCIF